MGLQNETMAAIVFVCLRFTSKKKLEGNAGCSRWLQDVKVLVCIKEKHKRLPVADSACWCYVAAAASHPPLSLPLSLVAC